MSEENYDLVTALAGLDGLHDVAIGAEEEVFLFDYQFGADLNHVFAFLFQHAPDFAAELGALPTGKYGIRKEDLRREDREKIASWRTLYLKHPYRDDPRVRNAAYRAK